jgi:hypothetical protein
MSFWCYIGLHKWRYFGDGMGRQCQRKGCYLWQYWLEGMYWVDDLLGSGHPRGPHKQWDDQEETDDE